MKILGPITDAQDAVNKAYADALSTGGAPASSIDKAPVRAIGLVNMNLTNPGTSIVDEVTLVANDRFALCNQTAGTENGIYVFTGSSTPPTRATDFDTNALVAAGARVYATEGLEMRGKEVYFYPGNGSSANFNLGIDNILDVLPNLTRRVVLSASVVSASVANATAAVGNLALSMGRGLVYRFRLYCVYSATATGTGSRWGIFLSNAVQQAHQRSNYSLTTTSRTFNEGLFDFNGNSDMMPAASNATSASTNSNIADVEGVILNSAIGSRTISARFAGETASGITAIGRLCWLEIEPIL